MWVIDNVYGGSSEGENVLKLQYYSKVCTTLY